jgi:hypothetical protein
MNENSFDFDPYLPIFEKIDHISKFPLIKSFSLKSALLDFYNDRNDKPSVVYLDYTKLKFLSIITDEIVEVSTTLKEPKFLNHVKINNDDFVFTFDSSTYELYVFKNEQFSFKTKINKKTTSFYSKITLINTYVIIAGDNIGYTILMFNDNFNNLDELNTHSVKTKIRSISSYHSERLVTCTENGVYFYEIIDNQLIQINVIPSLVSSLLLRNNNIYGLVSEVIGIFDKIDNRFVDKARLKSGEIVLGRNLNNYSFVIAAGDTIYLLNDEVKAISKISVGDQILNFKVYDNLLVTAHVINDSGKFSLIIKKHHLALNFKLFLY